MYSSEHQATEEVHETRSAKRVLLGTTSSPIDAAYAESSSCLPFSLFRASKVCEALTLATGFSAKLEGRFFTAFGNRRVGSTGSLNKLSDLIKFSSELNF